MISATPEQLAVIAHPAGRHARVLAVAGAGKTTTMVERVRELVVRRGIAPSAIAILMFNRLAREDFEAKLERAGLAQRQRPRVHTFHSFAYGFIREMMQRGALPGDMALWIGEKEELVRRTVHHAIRNLQTAGTIAVEGGARAPVEAEEAMTAIGLWKGSLIPPERAGTRGHPDLPHVYREYERLRAGANALTYDDFVPLAVRLISEDPTIAHRWTGRKDHLIVDEYQDINLGQQRLVELLAGKRADVMVVGDDDQTIYEWRGARPTYLLGEFAAAFANKPHADYRLTRSFRFGPVLAQAAQNMIGRNGIRAAKAIVAHDAARETRIEIVAGPDADRQLAEQLAALLDAPGTVAGDIIVLARMFAQLSGLEAELLARHIPYQVRGSTPFFARREVRVLLNYLRFALVLERPITRESEEQLLAIANNPSRLLRRDTLRAAMRTGRIVGQSALAALVAIADAPGATLGRQQRKELDKFLDLLEGLRHRLDGTPPEGAAIILQWLIKECGYLEHFDAYYGRGEGAAERRYAVQQFVAFAATTRLAPGPFLEHLARLDPAQGQPEEFQLTLTTIFRTKGLEYDYVVMPRCDEGSLPCLHGAGEAVFDTAGTIREPAASEAIENERRLFYVGLTRARSCTFLGTTAPPSGTPAAGGERPSRFLAELSLPSVVDVLLPYQRFLGGDATARGALLDGLRRHGEGGWVRERFVADYLPALPDKDGTLATAVGTALMAAPPTDTRRR